MNARRVITYLTSLALLLSLTAGLGAHEHDATGAGEFSCTADHLLDDSAAQATPQGELHAPGAAHEHHCLGCHFNGKRPLPRQADGASSLLDPACLEFPSPAPCLRTFELLTGGTLRGPPQA